MRVHANPWRRQSRAEAPCCRRVVGRKSSHHHARPPIIQTARQTHETLRGARIQHDPVEPSSMEHLHRPQPDARRLACIVRFAKSCSRKRASRHPQGAQAGVMRYLFQTICRFRVRIDECNHAVRVCQVTRGPQRDGVITITHEEHALGWRRAVLNKKIVHARLVVWERKMHARRRGWCRNWDGVGSTM